MRKEEEAFQRRSGQPISLQSVPTARCCRARKNSLPLIIQNLTTLWLEAQGTQLKRRFENASLYLRDLGEEQAERFGPGAQLSFQDWVERFGPVKACDIRIRRHTVKEMRSDARHRHEHDIGAAYALEFLSYHVEASCLPGEDAAFVYDGDVRLYFPGWRYGSQGWRANRG